MSLSCDLLQICQSDWSIIIGADNNLLFNFTQFKSDSLNKPHCLPHKLQPFSCHHVTFSFSVLVFHDEQITLNLTQLLALSFSINSIFFCVFKLHKTARQQDKRYLGQVTNFFLTHIDLPARIRARQHFCNISNLALLGCLAQRSIYFLICDY
jgi:hypothetical protein